MKQTSHTSLAQFREEAASNRDLGDRFERLIYRYLELAPIIDHLAPHGMAGFVLANGSMSSNQSGEGDIRRALIEADLVDCMVALPGQLFYSTQIPVCLWFIAKNKSVEIECNARLFDGETDLSLVA